MKVVLIVIVFFLTFVSKGSVKAIEAEIISEYLDNVINIHLKDQKIYLPEEFLNAPRLELGNPAISGITAVVDYLADKILENVSKLIIRNGLDPMELPNTTLKLIPTGTITLSSGWLQDTSSLSRNGNVTIFYSSTTKNLVINAPIKFDALMFTYQYLTKVLLLSIKGEAQGKVENLNINIQLSFNFETYQAALDNFDITNSGKLSLKFTGNGLVDWLTNIMSSIVTTFLHPVILNIIQSIIKGGLQNVVDSVNNFINSILHPVTSNLTDLIQPMQFIN